MADMASETIYAPKKAGKPKGKAKVGTLRAGATKKRDALAKMAMLMGRC